MPALLPAGISNSFQGMSAPDQLLTKMNRKMVVMNGTHGLPKKLYAANALKTLVKAAIVCWFMLNLFRSTVLYFFAPGAL